MKLKETFFISHMADPQFEEFRTTFESLPQHIKATPKCYQIAHDIDNVVNGCNLSDEDEETVPAYESVTSFQSIRSSHVSNNETNVQRKRRKLPQIPIGKEPLSKFRKWPRLFPVYIDAYEGNGNSNAKNNGVNCDSLYLEIEADGGHIKPYLRVKPNVQNSIDGGYSPDDFRERSCNDGDSGHSTSHTPDGTKSFSPAYNGTLSSSSLSTLSSAPSAPALQLQDATHRGLYRFVPRHNDEIEVDIGDPIYVQKEADDFWCEGTNLRTGLCGVFPSAYVTDVEYSDFDPEGLNVKKERYILDFMGSLEVNTHKGNKVLLQSVQKILKSEEFRNRENIHPCILEISDNGLRMVDRCKKNSTNVPTRDFFFNLKNVTFCGYHPYNHRYFGFVTKHPLKNKFACHIFMGPSSTRDVAEAVGRAFQRFYQKFVETMYPVEDIYIE